MPSKYKEYKQMNLSQLGKDINEFWKSENIFEKSVSLRDGNKPFVFYEGPPSANGKPGIHHVLARAIKDIFCRYKTLQGFQVKRKAGWDTHGLPVELSVEKELGITKEDIGKSISIEEYNAACKKAVMKYTDLWNDITEKIGYWVDMDDPYITYENKYIESVWYQLKKLYDQDLIYKGYTIQPYSPKAGTGLSSHELNQPGTYQDVKDTTVVALFDIKEESAARIYALLKDGKKASAKPGFIAWTTTPWTLPSNTALAVGEKISYLIVNTFNIYTAEPNTIILAENLLGKYFNPEHATEDITAAEFKAGEKTLSYEIIGKCKGKDLLDIQYHQLLDYALPYENPEEAFRVIAGDFVTTEDGTGIVHIAPTFGSDDAMVAKKANIPALLVLNDKQEPVPLVDLQGRFRTEMKELAGKFVKNEYYDANEAPDKSVDVEIAIKLKEEGKAFKVEKYEHSYPHCWRTDKPILYYPLDSWFVQSTARKERMTALNNTINWKPGWTGEKRFGEWLKNLNDWNLSRSRFWGIPLPLWRNEDGSEVKCIGSVAELHEEITKSIEKGFMTENPLGDFVPNDMSKENYDLFDLHKNVVDRIFIVGEDGSKMKRESDLIDVWFDSGSMPYAQYHYPFENKELIDNNKTFPADFIAEGVDQTRGWFFTLHAIATMNFDSIAYKNVMSNGLVLDKKGQKMSKRLGNAVDPFETIEKYGADATRWYMITNAQPWDNLKFDEEGIKEVSRKFFGTLYNTYNFFALYANLDNFSFQEKEIPNEEKRELDRWIMSKLNSLVKDVEGLYDDYEPTKAGRLIQNFVSDQLSNWYVRLSRRIFWKGEYEKDKISAYQTLYTCLETVAVLMSPIAPFFAEKLFLDLNSCSGRNKVESVHHANFPKVEETAIHEELEMRMDIAQRVSSLVLSLRKKEEIKVRQPLGKIMIPFSNDSEKKRIEKVKDLILSEVNVKEIEYMDENSNVLVKKVKPNFKALGPKYGKNMKAIANAINGFDSEEITRLDKGEEISVDIDGTIFDIAGSEVEITSADIPGLLVANDGKLTVALDITISEALRAEGIARELVNRVQNHRKESGFEVTDKINLVIKTDSQTEVAINDNKDYICAEILAQDIKFDETSEGIIVELEENVETVLSINKI
ncbi:MAG: isoleucyl-tRNA synthetase [Patiriisocius sp.]|jgi:isoleucyl-tRNA synthetase